MSNQLLILKFTNWGWGLGIGDWGLGPIPNPQSPIPNPQSPFYIMFLISNFYILRTNKFVYLWLKAFRIYI